MVTKEISVEISRPTGAVFAFLDDFANTPRWSGLCVSLTQISPGARAVGAQLHYIYKQGGKQGEMDGLITAHVPDRHSAMRLRDKLFEVNLDFQLSPAPSGTLLKHRTEIAPQGFFAKLMSGMIGPATEKQLAEDMARLKELLERGG